MPFRRVSDEVLNDFRVKLNAQRHYFADVLLSGVMLAVGGCLPDASGVIRDSSRTCKEIFGSRAVVKPGKVVSTIGFTGDGKTWSTDGVFPVYGRKKRLWFDTKNGEVVIHQTDQETSEGTSRSFEISFYAKDILGRKKRLGEITREESVNLAPWRKEGVCRRLRAGFDPDPRFRL